MTTPQTGALRRGEPEVILEAAVHIPVEPVSPEQDPRRPAPASDRPRHLHAVPARPARGRRPPRGLLAIAVLIGVALLVVVSLNVLLGQSGVSESDLERAIELKQQEVELLEIDVLRLAAPSRIHQRAEQLGLVSARDVSYLTPPTAPASASSPLGRGGR